MKRYITAMSFPRKKCLERFDRVSANIYTHVMKCVIYKDVLPDLLDHWCSEIGAWLNYANDTKCSSKLKEADYLTIFADFGNEVSDSRINLALFKADNKKLLSKHSDDAYPDFEITTQLVNEVTRFCADVVSMALPILMSGEVLSANEWALKIRNLL